MQGKWSDVRNFPSEEHKQSKNHCSPLKLESKKNDKKRGDPGRDRVGTLPAIVEKNQDPSIISISMLVYAYKVSSNVLYFII